MYLAAIMIAVGLKGDNCIYITITYHWGFFISTQQGWGPSTCYLYLLVVKYRFFTKYSLFPLFTCTLYILKYKSTLLIKNYEYFASI